MTSSARRSTLRSAGPHRLATSALLLAALLAGGPAWAQQLTISFASAETWELFDRDPALGSATSRGFAQPVCLDELNPPGCPADATLYGWTGVLGWRANLSTIPGAKWIWIPGTTGLTAPANAAFMIVARAFELPGSVVSASISVAVDDYVGVYVNGVLAGVAGSVTDYIVASQAQNRLSTFPLTARLTAGRNWITVYAQNIVTCRDPCNYQNNPAGVVFGGTITFDLATPVRPATWGGVKNLYRD